MLLTVEGVALYSVGEIFRLENYILYIQHIDKLMINLRPAGIGPSQIPPSSEFPSPPVWQIYPGDLCTCTGEYIGKQVG